MALAAAGLHSTEGKLRARRILVCLDGSAFSERCLPDAVSLAKTFDGAITLVHVMPSGHEQAGQQNNDVLGWEIRRQEARAYLERLQRQVSHSLGQPVDGRLEQGRPARRTRGGGS